MKHQLSEERKSQNQLSHQHGLQSQTEEGKLFIQYLHLLQQEQILEEELEMEA